MYDLTFTQISILKDVNGDSVLQGEIPKWLVADVDYLVDNGYLDRLNPDSLGITEKGKEYLKQLKDDPNVEFENKQKKAFELIIELLRKAENIPSIGYEVKVPESVLWLLKERYLYFTDLGKLKLQNTGQYLIDNAIEKIGNMINNDKPEQPKGW